MIKITRLNGRLTVVNAELIGTVEATPDTMITLTTGRKLAVLESVDQVIGLVYEYRRQVRLAPRVIESSVSGSPVLGSPPPGPSTAGPAIVEPPDATPSPLEPAVSDR